MVAEARQAEKMAAQQILENEKEKHSKILTIMEEKVSDRDQKIKELEK